ncbi:MAG: hypothetical protein GY710_10810 [Desulfobacteraceae bacterium]|nr:hypothetical protein [Desulfobacteraceae bacterium]
MVLKPKNKLGVIAGFVCCVLLATVWAGSCFLKTNTTKTILLHLISEKVPGQVVFDKLEIHPLLGQINLLGLQLRGPHGKSLARMKKMSLDLSWTSLLTGKICFSSVMMDSPRLNLSLLKNGSLAPGLSSVKTTNGSSWFFSDILVKKFVLKNGSLVLEVPGKNLNLSVSGLDVLVSNFDLLHGSAKFKANFETGNITTREKSILLNPTRMEADFKDGGLSNIFVHLDSNDLDMKILGSVKDLFNCPVFDIRLKSIMDLEQATFTAGIKPKAFQGQLLTNLSIKGDLDNPVITGSIQSKKAWVKGYLLENLMLEFKIKNRMATMLPSHLSSKFGALDLEGKINLEKVFPHGFLKPFDLNELSYNINALLSGTKLSVLSGIKPGTKGKVTSRINFSGRGVDPEKIKADIKAKLSATGLRLKGMPTSMAAMINTDIVLDKKTARINFLDLRAPSIILTGNGQVDITTMKISGKLNLKMGDIGLLNRLTHLRQKGQISAKIEINGPFSCPGVSLTASGSNIEINNVVLGNLTLKGNLDRTGRVRVDKFLLENHGSILNGTGWLESLKKMLNGNRKNLIHFDVKTGNLNLANFMPTSFFKGKLNGKIMVRSNLVKPIVRADIKGYDLAFKKVQIKDATLSLNGKIQSRFSNVDGVLNIDADSIKVFDQARGKFSSKFLLRGSLKNPQIKGKLDIQKIMILNEKQNPMDLTVKLQNKKLEIKADIGPMMEGVYHMDTKVFAVDFNVDGFNLSPYFALMGRSGFTGDITGSIKAKGRIDKLKQIQGSADFSKIMIAFAGNPFIQTKDSRLTFKNGQLCLLPTQIKLLKKGILMVKGQADLSGSLDFKALGDIPLELLNPLVDKIKFATGNVRITASLKGSIYDPIIQGDLLFNSLGMGVDGLDQDFKNMKGHIKFTPDKIEISGFEGYMGQGRFDLGGSVILKAWAPEKFNLKINAHQLNLDIQDLMDLTFNCNLNFVGTDKASQLTGGVMLLGGSRYHKDVKLNLITMATRQTRQIPSEGKKAMGFLHNISLNLDVGSREPLLVDNNLAYLEISPNLTIRGTAATPVLIGRARVDGGRIHFQRAELEVQKGVINFVNPYKTKPVLDIEAKMEIRAWTITLAISGSPDNLNLQLSSDPFEQRMDILSLILLGKTTREFGDTNGGRRFGSDEIIANVMASSLEKSLKEATGLDYLKITPQIQELLASSGVDVMLGTNLSRHINVKYGVDVRKGKVVQRVITSYQLLENLLLDGYRDTDGRFGGELKYRLEFR